MKKEVRDFGKRIKAVRLGKHLSQGDVAKILGVHRSYISGLERGARTPSLTTIYKVAKALGVSVKEII